MTTTTLTPTKATNMPPRRSHLVRNRLIGVAVVALALAPQVILQSSASGSVSRSALAQAAGVAVETASVSTLTVRSSMNVAGTLAKNSHVKEMAMHSLVLRTRAALRAAPVSARPKIQRALTRQTATWQAWARLSKNRYATYARLVRLNAATEADFRAKSAKALLTAYAVPARQGCLPAANPYAGGSRRRVVSYPGMGITQYDKRGHTPLWVTTANLNAPGAAMSVGPLTGPYVAARTQLAAQIKNSGAVAGVNGDFYNMDNSPWGGVIKRRGGIVNSTTNVSRKGFVVANSGLASIDFVDVRPVLRQGRYSVRADSLNSHSLPLNGIAVFTSQWGPASRGYLKARQTVREYVVDHRGVITATRPRSSKIAIPKGGLVIVAQGSALRRLNTAGFGRGKRVKLPSSATSRSGKGIYSTIGVGMQFLQNGINLTCANDRPVARTAIGIRPGGREILLVTVRGQTDSATAHFSGMSVREMAVFMRSLGVYNAAMFDGGGSTILMAKIGPKYQQFLGAPKFIRPVSNSLGIWRR